MEKQKKEGSNIKYIIIYWERLSLSLLPSLKTKQRYIYISLLSLPGEEGERDPSEGKKIYIKKKFLTNPPQRGVERKVPTKKNRNK